MFSANPGMFGQEADCRGLQQVDRREGLSQALLSVFTGTFCPRPVDASDFTFYAYGPNGPGPVVEGNTDRGQVRARSSAGTDVVVAPPSRLTSITSTASGP